MDKVAFQGESVSNFPRPWVFNTKPISSCIVELFIKNHNTNEKGIPVLCHKEEKISDLLENISRLFQPYTHSEITSYTHDSQVIKGDSLLKDLTPINKKDYILGIMPTNNLSKVDLEGNLNILDEIILGFKGRPIYIKNGETLHSLENLRQQTNFRFKDIQKKLQISSPLYLNGKKVNKEQRVLNFSLLDAMNSAEKIWPILTTNIDEKEYGSHQSITFYVDDPFKLGIIIRRKNDEPNNEFSSPHIVRMKKKQTLEDLRNSLQQVFAHELPKKFFFGRPNDLDAISPRDESLTWIKDLPKCDLKGCRLIDIRPNKTDEKCFVITKD